jgi:hypothetical protein
MRLANAAVMPREKAKLTDVALWNRGASVKSQADTMPPINIEEGGKFLLSQGQCGWNLVVRHVETLRKSGYPSITSVSFGLVRGGDALNMLTMGTK